MDFRRLSKLLPEPDFNSTSPPNLTDLPPNILEALIPGYSIISRYATAYLGFDISVFVSIGVLFFAITKGGGYLQAWLGKAFTYLFMSSVYIDEHDDLFDMVMGWLAEHQESASRSRRMRAKTQRGSKAEEAFDASALDAVDENGMFNYNKWSARTPPRFEPYYGRQFVYHNGQIFWFHRSRRPNEGQRLQVSFGNAAEDDIIQLDCIGRSIEPIKALLRSVRVWSSNKTSGTTTIRHPTPKDRARFGGTWSKTSSRPSRPMDTVILDAEQKSMIIRDMNEYLHPASPKWYATRGIPYRRGYLFHGPPGTGKTSLSFALAGIFGLEIYAISLQEPTLSEGDLMQLFNGLPRRCIVLLEDVDAAGLIRDGASDDKDSKAKKRGGREKKEVSGSEQKDEKTEKDAASEKPKKDAEYTLRDLAKELKAIGGAGGGGPRQRGSPNQVSNQNSQSGTGISLSGLLNAIDGVATHEGRVLIMTTNHPEKLDAALVRPGRVDRKVEFRLAMKEQVRELFVRMYAASDEVSRASSGSRTIGKAANGAVKAPSADSKAMNGHAKGATSSKPELETMSRVVLEELAEEFASHVPDDTFTPAEVQNLLMRYKTEPRMALAKVQDWMREVEEEKEKLEVDEKEDDVVDAVAGAEQQS